MILKLSARLRRHDDAGFAMLTVLLAMVILTLLGSALLANAMMSLPQARHEQDYNAALGAAEAGIDDYIARLNQNYDYAKLGTGTADGNLAFTTFVPVNPNSGSSCSTVPMPSCFTYTIDISQLASRGDITLTSTGQTGKVRRTVRVGLRPYGFLDALSQTDYNIVDPALQQLGGQSVDQTMAACKHYAYETWKDSSNNPHTGPLSDCAALLNYWITGNVLAGPMQSNDDFYLCGTPTFKDTVDSGDPTTPQAPPEIPFVRHQACDIPAPSFSAGVPHGNRKITLPPSPKTLKDFTTPGDPAKGCLYTGPTAITLNSTTMTVVSPDTKVTNNGCVGTNKPFPANRTIYVQDIPGSGDVNSGSCQVTVAWSGDACTQGDAFVTGTLADRLTIAADNNIVVTGNVTYDPISASNPTPVLGLIATNSVEINHPLDGNGNNLTGKVFFDSTKTTDPNTTYTVPLINPTVSAAILSLQHSFAVLNFGHGSSSGLGAVHLFGTVAGRFMDIEGTFSGNSLVNGYDVDYSYDARLRNGGLVPPNFLDPAVTFWHRVSFVDCGSGAALRVC